MTEETAVDIFDLRPVEVHVDDSNLRAHAFLVTGWTGEPMNVAPEEHDALAWFGRRASRFAARPSQDCDLNPAVRQRR